MADTKGSKIHKHPAIEEKIVSWIYYEPSITDYAISQKLKTELNFKAVQQVVKAWREKYLAELLEEFKKKMDMFTSNEVSSKIDFKLDNLQTLNRFIDKFNKRLEVLDTVQPTYDYTPEVIKNEDGTETIRLVTYVGRGELGIISEHTNMAKFVVDLMEKRDKLIGNFNPFDIAKDTVEKMLGIVARYLKLTKDSEEYKRFSEDLATLEENLKERYNIAKK